MTNRIKIKLTANFERSLADIEQFLTEANNATAELKAKLATLAGTSSSSLSEYVMKHYLVLYVQVEDSLFLLSIKHHKQLSFDFEGHWGPSP